ncbi:MAG TPA: 3-dehydroquinate synthase [Chloroflexota bacterium]|nr:3-dehydroquinate synthase [Chloroflexota bacterium]
MRALVLTGFMGTGKTTAGRILADRYGFDFFDTDGLIEARGGRSIREIFAEDGETAFRALETEMLGEALRGSGRVIATGGGALVSEDNRRLIGPDHRVICLTCSDTEELLLRLEREREVRPFFENREPEQLLALLAERESAYRCFDRLDTAATCPGEVVEEIAGRYGLASASLALGPGTGSEIVFERGLMGSGRRLFDRAGISGRLVIVTDAVIRESQAVKALLDRFTAWREPAHAPVMVVLPAGEQHKTLRSAEQVYRACLSARVDRSATIVGVGGGVICDIAGFAAATYLRGIRLVLVPTTLVAQVDAAIGGKTGVDFEGTKNIVGAFHPAERIMVDPELLQTLPDSALADGLAEIVKIGAVFSDDLLQRTERLSTPRDVLEDFATIRRAAELKAQVVQRDPYERGERALLNFGHTVGHGIEAASGYRLSHGTSISVGMVAETWLAERKGIADTGLGDRLRALLGHFALPAAAPGLDPAAVMEFVLNDKKRLDGRIRLGFPTSVGDGVVGEATEEEMRAAIAYATGGAT